MSVVTKHPTAFSFATLTAGVTQAKGAWVQLRSSLAVDSQWATCFGAFGGNSTLYLTDIGLGAAASEVVAIADYCYNSGASAQTNDSNTELPLGIPAGTRIAARNASGLDKAASGAAVWTMDGDLAEAPTLTETWGAVAASAAGTQIDPGATPSTYGAYAQLTASTTLDNDWIAVIMQPSQFSGTSLNAALYFVALATGAAASEVVILPDLQFRSSSTNHQYGGPFSWQFKIETVNAGTRIAARGWCSSADATFRKFRVVAIGVKVATANRQTGVGVWGAYGNHDSDDTGTVGVGAFG